MEIISILILSEIVLAFEAVYDCNLKNVKVHYDRARQLQILRKEIQV